MKKLCIALSLFAVACSSCSKKDNTDGNTVVGLFEKEKAYLIEEDVYTHGDTVETYYNFGRRYSMTKGGVTQRDTVNTWTYTDTMMIRFMDTLVVTYYRPGYSILPQPNMEVGGYYVAGDILYMDYLNIITRYDKLAFRKSSSGDAIESVDGRFKMKIKAL